MSAPIAVSFAASAELVEALDAEAFEADLSRAAVVRTILTLYLRKTGRMGILAPPTTQIARSALYRAART